VIHQEVPRTGSQ